METPMSHDRNATPADRRAPRALTTPPRLDPGVIAGIVRPRYALLINPFYPKDPHASFGKHVLTPSLALTSIAGATPPHWQVKYWDENLLQGPPPWRPMPQVVGISVHLTFAARAFELAAWYRKRGAIVILGGLHVLSCPDECAPHADALAIGEGVQLWPRILADVEAGRLEKVYRGSYTHDYRDEPPPRRDVLPRASFLTTTSLIATRGCHNRCGFCYLATDGLRMPYQMLDVEQVTAQFRADDQPYAELGGWSRSAAAATRTTIATSPRRAATFSRVRPSSPPRASSPPAAVTTAAASATSRPTACACRTRCSTSSRSLRNSAPTISPTPSWAAGAGLPRQLHARLSRRAPAAPRRSPACVLPHHHEPHRHPRLSQPLRLLLPRDRRPAHAVPDARRRAGHCAIPRRRSALRRAGRLEQVCRGSYTHDYRDEPPPRRDVLPRASFLTTTSLIATRGCHNRCGFCYLATDGLRMPYQMLDVEQVTAQFRADDQPYA